MDNLTTQSTKRRRKCGFKCNFVKLVKTQDTLFVEEQKMVQEKWNDRIGHLHKVNFYKAFVLSSGSYSECLNRFQARLKIVQERIMHFLGVKIEENSTVLLTDTLPFYRADDERFDKYIRVDEMQRFKVARIINILEDEQKDLYNYMSEFIKHCDVRGSYNL